MPRKHFFSSSFGISFLLLLTGCGNGSGGAVGSGGNSQGSVPVLTSIFPSAIPSGSVSMSITANGSGFVSGSVVEWNGTPLKTTYTNVSQVSAQIPNSYVATSGVVQISVFNSGAGGTSNALTLSVTNLAPTLYSISPANAPVGSPAITLTVSGKNFSSNSQINWNGAALTTTFVSTSQLTTQVPAANLTPAGYAQVSVVSPSPGGGQSASSTFSILSGSNHVSIVAANANDIIWDATRGKIYASLPSANGASGNSLVAIDPVTGTMGTPQYVGSEPDKLALSSDASHIWVGIDGSFAVQRFTLPGLTPDANIAVPGNGIALSIRAAPINPHTVAVLPEGSNGFSSCCVTVYDDAIARPMTRNWAFSGLQWGANDSTLYGGDLYAGMSNFSTMAVDSTGVSNLTTYPNVYGISVGGIHYDAQSGYVYADNGQVIDPSTGGQIGTLNLDYWLMYNGQVPQPRNSVYPKCVPDSAQGVVFCLGMGGSSYVIQSFDEKTYRLLDTLPIPQATASAGAAVNLIRWGKAGLAFNTAPTVLTTSNPGSIFLIDGSFVNSTAPPDTTNGNGVEVTPVMT